MGEESAESGHRRIFISYSRADRARVRGLADLLAALGHEVFVDTRSIPAGAVWEESLAASLAAADALLVFWTRHAARSDWVRKEFQSFGTAHPDRPIVPLTGDETPLPEMLAARQTPEFLPLVNELLEMTRDLAKQGIAQREIRAAVARRLAEAGVELPRERRSRVFGFLGAAGIASAPLFYLERAGDLMAEAVARVPGAGYTVGGVAAAAGAAGIAVCTALPNGEATTGVLLPNQVLVPVNFGKTLDQACRDEELYCLGGTLTRIVDSDRRFFGFSTPSCAAKVIKRESCEQSFGTKYAIDNVRVFRSPNADPDATVSSNANYFCLTSDEGQPGIFESAICMKPD